MKRFHFSISYFGLFLVLGLMFILPSSLEAATVKTNYPRLANYFLPWEIKPEQVSALAKWDLLIVDMEAQKNSALELQEIRRLNPEIIILAYINSVEIVDGLEYYQGAEMRTKLASKIIPGWYLKDSSGNKISNWPGNFMLNLTLGAELSGGERFHDYLPQFVATEIKTSGLWDGVFFDNTWGDISWLNQGNIDVDNNGLKDEASSLDAAWSEGFKKVLIKTKELTGDDFIIVGNGRVYEGYQRLLNGMMLESFPSSWEADGTWTGSMKSYLKIPTLNLAPAVTVVNSSSKNQADYRRFRFGFASTLLGNGFYSFDYDISDHGQTWWYDEYDINLGPAKSAAYNLLNNRGTELQSGLWRRDFKYGSAIVNSTNKEQLYVFQKEEVGKIKGSQDAKFNTGLKINYLKLAPQDGAIILNLSTTINNSAFTNGYFYRVYNLNGNQVRNGFFPYLNSFPGEQEIIIPDHVSSISDFSLSAGFGQVELRKDGIKLAAFYPYGNYRGRINLAAEIKNGKVSQIITGPNGGGGAQVSIFSPQGKLLGSFFAYDKKYRTGVHVALADLNGDGQMEIITGPGSGSEPMVKIFTPQGKLQTSFLAYDKNFKGGVSVATGDVNGDGRIEIITGPGIGGGPHVRVFSQAGKVLASFFAYDKNYRGGIRVTVSDINSDGQAEILTGIRNFY